MSTENFDSNLYLNNLILTSNFIELGNSVIIRIAGNDISTNVDGGDISDVLKNILAAKLNQKLSHYRKDNDHD